MRSLDASPPFPTYAEPNYVYRATATPNDPLYAQQDDLHTTGRLGGTPAADPDAPEAWDIAQLGGFPSTGGAEIGSASTARKDARASFSTDNADVEIAAPA